MPEQWLFFPSDLSGFHFSYKMDAQKEINSADQPWNCREACLDTQTIIGYLAI